MSVPDQLICDGSSGSAYELANTSGVRIAPDPGSTALPACTARVSGRNVAGSSLSGRACPIVLLSLPCGRRAYADVVSADEFATPLRDPLLVAAFEGWNDAGTQRVARSSTSS